MAAPPGRLLRKQMSMVDFGKYTVLHAPGLERLAKEIAEELGGTVPVLCTSNVLPNRATGLCWDCFPSGDPNIKLRVDAIRDRHVLLLMNHDTLHLFEQMAVLLFKTG